MLEDELQIIKKAQNGEAEAFGVLYDHYMPMIYRFILVKVGIREEAEDLTHQTFLKAWQNVTSAYSEKGLPFGSWLYRIAKNTVIDSYRRQKTTYSLEDNETNEALISRPRFAEDLDLADNIKHAMSAISTLKPEEQQVIMMRFIEDIPIKNVARSLEKSEGAIKLIQYRAMAKLRKILGK